MATDTDTAYLDTNEKVDILLKQAFGFPSTSEKNSGMKKLLFHIITI
jgi:hypothetical protein